MARFFLFDLSQKGECFSLRDKSKSILMKSNTIVLDHRPSIHTTDWIDPNLYPFHSRFIDIDGHKVHYIDEGEGQIILFSHPPIGWSFMYRDLIRCLRHNFRCIAIDYPGFGPSREKVDYIPSLERQALILHEFITKLQLKNIVLLGHDTGGPSAFGLAVQHPHWFKGFILTDTIIFPVSEYARISRMLGIVGSRLFTWFNITTNFLLRLSLRFGFSTKRFSKQEKKMYFESFKSTGRRRNMTRMLYSLKESEEWMKKLKSGFETTLNEHPALLIYGAQDPVAQLGIADRTHQLLAQSELYYIEGEAHFPHEGRAVMMADLITRWIHGVRRLIC